MSKYMKKLQEIREEIKKQDNLSVSDILKGDMYQYHKDLNIRAQKVLDQEIKDKNEQG